MKNMIALRISILFNTLLLAMIIVSACTSQPSSPSTLEPTAISLTKTAAPEGITVLSKPPELIPAVDKPWRDTSITFHVVFTMPEMEKTLLASELTYYKKLTVDIYYPPGYNFSAKLPFVVLAHGIPEINEYWKDITPQIDWAKLIAASGMIAVSGQVADSPVGNSNHLFEFLALNADFLGIDFNRIGFWACSSQGDPVFVALINENLSYRSGFKAVVFLYLDLEVAIPTLGMWPKNLSIFIVKAGRDSYTTKTATDLFVKQARSSNLSVEYIELPDAIHAFDIYQDTPESKEAITQALEFYKNKLLY